MREYYWVDTDKWSLREAVLDIVSDGAQVVDVVVFQDEEVWVLVRSEL